jgi:hypothetical protein
MKTNHHQISTRRCAHCGQRFDINPRIGRRQRYCAKPNCIRASRKASQKKWLRQLANRDHFKGHENVDRVRDWRKAHPAYWQKKGRLPGLTIKKELASLLRDVALSGFTKRHLLVLLEATRMRKCFQAFQCYHTEPKEYPVSGGSGRSRGISSPKSIELLRGPFFPSKDTILIIFLGYEGHRAHSLWQNLEPNRTFLVIPDPAYRVSWTGRTQKQNNLLLSALPPEVLLKSHSLMARDTVALLEKTLLGETALVDRYNVWIAPFGTKAQTLGLFWFWAAHPRVVSVVNASPVLYETSEIFVEAGDSWLIGQQSTTDHGIVTE